jgi:hypothetical protein
VISPSHILDDSARPVLLEVGEEPGVLFFAFLAAKWVAPQQFKNLMLKKSMVHKNNQLGW